MSGRPDESLSGLGCCEAQGMFGSAPDTISSNLTNPGRIGNPAASADVQPDGRKASERKSKIAPELARQLLSDADRQRKARRGCNCHYQEPVHADRPSTVIPLR